MTPPRAAETLKLLVQDLAAGRLRVVDLTQTLSPKTPVLPLPPPWTPSPGFEIRELSRYDERGPAWYWNAFTTGEHTGTHFDAPIHWVTGKDLPDASVDLLPPASFVGPACVIDVSDRAARDPDFLLQVDDVTVWEERHGRIPRGAWVLLRTDWSRRGTSADYVNLRDDGPHSPGWSRDCSELLATERDILGVGTETVGTDAGRAAAFDPPFANHHFMHGNGRCGLAGLCNLDLLPPVGAVVVAAPLKIVNGSGSPVRAIAITA